MNFSWCTDIQYDFWHFKWSDKRYFHGNQSLEMCSSYTMINSCLIYHTKRTKGTKYIEINMCILFSNLSVKIMSATCISGMNFSVTKISSSLLPVYTIQKHLPTLYLDVKFPLCWQKSFRGKCDIKCCSSPANRMTWLTDMYNPVQTPILKVWL